MKSQTMVQTTLHLTKLTHEVLKSQADLQKITVAKWIENQLQDTVQAALEAAMKAHEDAKLKTDVAELSQAEASASDVGGDGVRA